MLQFNAGTLTPDDTQAIAAFADKFLVKKELVVAHLQHLNELKMKKEMRQAKRSKKKSKPAAQRTSDNDEEEEKEETDSESKSESESSSESEANESDDEEDNVVLNVVGDDEDITFVPRIRTVTRHGRLAGTWRRALQDSSADSSSEESESETEIMEPEEQSEEEQSEREHSEESGQESESDSESAHGSEPEEPQSATPVPETRTVTRHGRVAGTWKRSWQRYNE